ncbi:MarC family protein [Photobacterium sp. DA100]|uniref:MarC family protein n=1 Tax=Photobacterium sp. DA100 TaxID=3027472 RepID=UPI0024793842|nr:MarC family protein [Photobacterium sp. DA100]WEM43743.1 MarC family protein [Photobacterium sp. DA100]
MHDLLTVSVTVFMGFFAIMNPIANTAVFIGLTSAQTRQQQRATAFKALVTAFCIVAAFSLLGKGIFHVFGITLPALRISGGILVFLVGYHMLQGSSSSMHRHQEEDNQSKTVSEDQDVAISPLALPILAGPGTIATAMNYSAAGGFLSIAVTISAFAVLCLISLVCFIYGQKLVSVLGDNGISIVTRLMGLILTVIGMQMGIQGIHDAIALFDHLAK